MILRTDLSLHVNTAGDWASQQMKGWQAERQKAKELKRTGGCFEVAGCKKSEGFFAFQI